MVETGLEQVPHQVPPHLGPPTSTAWWPTVCIGFSPPAGSEWIRVQQDPTTETSGVWGEVSGHTHVLSRSLWAYRVMSLGLGVGVGEGLMALPLLLKSSSELIFFF